MGYKDIVCGIYCIRNLINDKRYIGQSVNIKARWKQHQHELRHGIHCNDFLQKSWNKHGEESFVFEIIEECKRQELDDKERYYIDFYHTLDEDYGYNLKSGGQDHPKNTKVASQNLSKALKKIYEEHPEKRQAQRQRSLKQWANPQIKAKIMGKNNGMYGRNHTLESRKKMSEGHKGKPNWRRDHRPVRCIQLDEVFSDVTEAGHKLGFDGSTILQVCYGNRKICQGYHWEFANEEDRKQYQDQKNRKKNNIS